MPLFMNSLNIDALLFMGYLILGLACLLVLMTIGLRIRLIRQNKRQQQLVTTWTTIFQAPSHHKQCTMEHLGLQDRQLLLALWMTHYDKAQDSQRPALLQLAHRLRFPNYSHQLFRRKTQTSTLLGIQMFGYLRLTSAWAQLAPLIHDPNTMLSITTAHALFRIDAIRALNLCLPLILKRTDWSQTKVAHMLQEVEPVRLAEPLMEAILRGTSVQAIRLLRLLSATHCYPVLPHLRTYLDSRKLSVDVHAAALQCLTGFADTSDLPRFQRILAHRNWILRVRGAIALGRIGTREEMPLLISLLSDSHWWVRYRAAESLSSLPGVSQEELHAIHQSHPDRFGQDSLATFLTPAIPDEPWQEEDLPSSQTGTTTIHSMEPAQL